MCQVYLGTFSLGVYLNLFQHCISLIKDGFKVAYGAYLFISVFPLPCFYLTIHSIQSMH